MENNDRVLRKARTDRSGVVRALLEQNGPIHAEDWRVISRKLVNALAPSAQAFRGMGKSFSGRGSGTRLTDRGHYR